jgi:hypothetical protein
MFRYLTNISCGIDQLYGFWPSPKNQQEFNKQLRAVLKGTFASIIIASLNNDQHEILGPMLKKAGFQEVTPRVINNNTGHGISLWAKVLTDDEKQKYAGVLALPSCAAARRYCEETNGCSNTGNGSTAAGGQAGSNAKGAGDPSPRPRKGGIPMGRPRGEGDVALVERDDSVQRRRSRRRANRKKPAGV